MMKKKILIRKTLMLLALGFIAILICDFAISYNAKNRTYNTVYNIPKNKVGLVLGVGKYTQNGLINQYYSYRLEAAVELFQANKIEYILVSGDHSSPTYNEPLSFKNDLILNGIPEDRIVLDYAGLRTLDSTVRAHKIFGLNRFTFISQQFHNERAILLADAHNLSTIGYNAKDVGGSYGRNTKLREYLARPKAMLDIVFNTQPKYLGPQIQIN